MRFTTWAKTFDEHKTGLRADISLEANLQVIHPQQRDRRIEEDFQLQLRFWETAEERDLRAFVESKSGTDQTAFDTFMGQDQLMTEFVKLDRKLKPKGTDSKAKGGKKPDDFQRLVLELRKELKEDFDEILKKTQKPFEEGLAAQKDQMNSQFKEVLSAVRGEWYEMVKDKYLWKQNSWKRSIKARHLVTTLRDHYIESYVPATVQELTEGDDNKTAEASSKTDKAPVLDSEDRWTLSFITVHRIQPLIEDLDADISGFVTVHEANAFVSSPPENWSLLHRLAYSTIGFEMTLRYYYVRVANLMRALTEQMDKTQRYNRMPFMKFEYNYEINLVVNRIMAGLFDTLYGDPYNYDEGSADLWITKFQEFVMGEEEVLEARLKACGYGIDDQRALDLVLGSNGRLEKKLLPLIYLLLLRAWKISSVKNIVLDREAFDPIIKSMTQIKDRVDERVRTLKAIFSSREGQDSLMNKFSYGMYRYFIDPYGVDEEQEAPAPYYRYAVVTNFALPQYTELPELVPVVQIEELQTSPAAPLPVLQRVDHILQSSQEKKVTGPIPFPDSPFLGVWYGFLKDKDTKLWLEGGLHKFSFNSILEPGQLVGAISMPYFSSAVNASYSGHSLHLVSEPDASDLQRDTRVRLWYVGELDTENDKINGVWGVHDPRAKETLDLDKERPESWGTLELTRRPPPYDLSSDSDHESSRDKRIEQEQFIQLFSRVEDEWHCLDWQEWNQFQYYQHTIDPDDIQFYKFLARNRREVTHPSAICDSCGRPPTGSRHICLDCKTDSLAQTFDLCGECATKDVLPQHYSNHVRIQLRKPFPMRDIYKIRDDASSKAAAGKQSLRDQISDKIDAEGTHRCAFFECNKIILHPCWYCVDCEHETFICDECNSRVEKEPWNYDIADSSGAEKKENEGPPVEEISSHPWEHTLVSLPAEERQLLPSVDERLQVLEDRVNNMTAMIGKLTAMLTKEREVTEN
ncbi:hypothetical protein VKT23_015118 [Stygiomarasmius scandens]|uniref:ZZ-type domain-containing protein n=1 Tax=Marasmiellus scandens TaxID=2682957 RepID=A0ABR1J157_9AGAR